jgi:transposase
MQPKRGTSTATTLNASTQAIRRLARECELESPVGGEVECDESYFGGRRQGRRGRDASGKVPVFGLPRQSARVYTRIAKDTSRKTPRQIIRTKVVPGSVT